MARTALRQSKLNASDLPNLALNHAAITVASSGTIPQLGFVHEDSGQGFVLDIADLKRHDLVLKIAFGTANEALKGLQTVDRLVRQRAGDTFRRKGTVPEMINAIKTVLGDDGGPEGEASMMPISFGEADRSGGGGAS